MFDSKLSIKAKTLFKQFKHKCQDVRDEFTSVLGVATFTDLKSKGAKSFAKVGEWEIVREATTWSARHASWKDYRVFDALTLGALVNGRTSLFF